MIIIIAAQRPLRKSPDPAPGDPVSQIFMTMEHPKDRKLAKPFSVELNTCKGHSFPWTHPLHQLTCKSETEPSDARQIMGGGLGICDHPALTPITEVNLEETLEALARMQ